MNFSSIPQNPKILLYGYGLEGKSSERWAEKHLNPRGIDIFEDHQTEKPDWLRYDLIIKSPGVPPSAIPDAFWPKVTSNLRLFLENLSEQNRAKIIGITGSKGKSTTAKFTHELLQTAGFKSVVIGNYGVPALDIWEKLETLDFIVAECSSFQLYDLKVSPKYALFLSFFPDHLDWHNQSEIDYFKAKENLWAHQEKGDFLAVPDSLLVLVGLALTHREGKERPNSIVFTQTVKADFFPKNSILQALHFRQNLGPVWALAQQLKINNLETVWEKTTSHFEPIEHRLEKFYERNGFSFYNDSIATSPNATQAGVTWLGANLAGLILDGTDTGIGDFKALAETLVSYAPKARVALIESEIAISFAKAVKDLDLTVQTFADYSLALDWLMKQSFSGAILFSPGGKSFNRFNNYAERGKAFKNLVLKLF